MVLIIKDCRESHLLQYGLNLWFSFLFRVFGYTYRQTRPVTQPSFLAQPFACHHLVHDPALHDGTVFIMKYEKMTTGTLKIATDFGTSGDFVCKDCITEVIHPKVKLYT